MKCRRALRYERLACALASICMTVAAEAGTADRPLPRLEHRNGRHALIVDGEPFLILGAESNNSSAWPVVLPKVWSAMEALHANTLEIPIPWEQFEPRPGEFDYSVVDTIIEGTRERGLRLVLLWFSTWKNGSKPKVDFDELSWMNERDDTRPV